MTSNDTLLERFQKMEVKNTEVMGEVRGDIKVLVNEVKRLNDTVDSQVKLMMTKEEAATMQKQADEVHKGLTGRIDKLEEWNTWAVRIVVGAVIVSGLVAIGLKAF